MAGMLLQEFPRLTHHFSGATNTMGEQAPPTMDVDQDTVMQDDLRDQVHVTGQPGAAGDGGETATSTRDPSASTLAVPNSVPRASSLPPSFFEPDKRNVGYVYDTLMLSHAPINDHPERPERIASIYKTMQSTGLLKSMKLISIRKVKKLEALLVHSEDHWQKVEAIQAMSKEDISMSESYYEHLSLYVCPQTTMAAQLSCGGVIECCLAVARGDLRKSLAIVRPPGHHAEPEEHMGFCFFNNVAVAARVVQEMTNLKRILILDWDVHHGNGTQRAFLDDPSVLYISIHRYDNGEYYPCGPFGGLTSCGEGEGLGRSVNIPWPGGGMGDAEYIHAFHKIVMPIAMEFAPELVIISAGFDSADGDELGECHVTPKGYAHMTHMLSSLAGGKLVVALEGGYNIDATTTSVTAVTRMLIGDAPPELDPMTANEIGTETVWQVAMQQSKYWNNVDPKTCEPKDEYPGMAIPIPQILKVHRQEYLYQQHNMLQVPLLEELDTRFAAQVICSEDVMQQEVLVLFIHQLGNIRVELEGAMTCNLNLEFSYLIDVTRDLIAWVRKQGYSLIEINTHPQVRRGEETKTMAAIGRELVTYVWDNYVLLSSAKAIVFVGHGPGCEALMELIVARTNSVMNKVSSVVQVVGNAEVPTVPKGSDMLRSWYIKNSFIAVPTHHRLFRDNKILKRHGRIMRYEEDKPVKLLKRAFPDITQFIQDSIPPPSNNMQN